MSILRFNINDLKPLAEHARTSAARRPRFDQLFEAKYRLDGKEYDGKGFPEPSDIDPTKLDPEFWLVKDEGIYLISNGDPPMYQNDAGTSLVVVYAEGFDPTKRDRMEVWDDSRAAVGGDDFTQGVPIEWFELAQRHLNSTEKFMTIEFGPTQFSLILE